MSKEPKEINMNDKRLVEERAKMFEEKVEKNKDKFNKDLTENEDLSDKGHKDYFEK